MQIFVKARGDPVLHGRFHTMGCETCAQILAESSGAPAVAESLPTCSCSHPRQGTFTKRRMFPVFDVRVPASGG